jgi:hypothetical protein
VKPFRISHPASAEFADAVRWYEQKRIGLGAAAGRTRSWLLSRFPYRVIYRVRDEDIYIVAIAHTSRRPGYWKDRG